MEETEAQEYLKRGYLAGFEDCKDHFMIAVADIYRGKPAEMAQPIDAYAAWKRKADEPGGGK